MEASSSEKPVSFYKITFRANVKESALRQESLLVLVIQQLFHGVPAQHCALYAGRHVGDILQRTGFFQLFNVGIGSFALNHLQKGLGQVFGFIHAAANDHVQHDICRSLGDRAAVTNKAAVLNLAVFYFQLQNKAWREARKEEKAAKEDAPKRGRGRPKKCSCRAGRTVSAVE